VVHGCLTGALRRAWSNKWTVDHVHEEARQMTRSAWTCCLLTVVLGLAACGGTQRTGEASKSPDRIVADLATAVGGLHSYRIQGTTTDAHGVAQVTAEVAGPGRLAATLRRGPISIELISLAGVTYFRATTSYWAAQGDMTPAQVSNIANHWVKLPNSVSPELQAGVTRITNLARSAHCWTRTKGTLSITGTGTVNGRPAVIVSSDGSEPGSARGSTYIASTGPAWPLRTILTGPPTPGGPAACSVQGESLTAESITFSGFNQPVSLSAPTGAVDLTSALR
jgi:hypothetical protein